MLTLNYVVSESAKKCFLWICAGDSTITAYDFVSFQPARYDRLDSSYRIVLPFTDRERVEAFVAEHASQLEALSAALAAERARRNVNTSGGGIRRFLEEYTASPKFESIRTLAPRSRERKLITQVLRWLDQEDRRAASRVRKVALPVLKAASKLRRDPA